MRKPRAEFILVAVALALPAWAEEEATVVGESPSAAPSLGQPAPVSTGREIVLKQDRTRRSWRIGDHRCVYYSGPNPSCGVVVKTDPQKVVLVLDNAKTPRTREPSSEESFDEAVPVQPYGWYVAAGIALGFDYYYPMLHLERRIGRKWTIGLMPLFSVGSSAGLSNVAVYGGALTATLHLNRSAMMGFLFEGLVNYYHITSTDAVGFQAADSAGLAALFGWRARSNYGFTIFLAGGPSYNYQFAGKSTSIQFSGVRPLFTIEIGYCF